MLHAASALSDWLWYGFKAEKKCPAPPQCIRALSTLRSTQFDACIYVQSIGGVPGQTLTRQNLQDCSSDAGWLAFTSTAERRLPRRPTPPEAISLQSPSVDVYSCLVLRAVKREQSVTADYLWLLI
ncbi:hypothetical protein MJO29_008941 [Puccinia striiformis f. sp. tritici]|nr:hypothetical protein MJO29_008941 [Puccinia striiformis f. sp. tritici]